MGRYTDTAPAYNAAEITPNDATIIPMTRAIYVGVSGNVAVRMAGGTTITFNAVPAGMLQVQIDKVLSTGTTAAAMIAHY